MGAAGYHALAKRAGRIAGERGWTLERVTHLLDRYGDETPALLASIDDTDAADPEARLGEPLAEAPTYLRAESPGPSPTRAPRASTTSCCAGCAWTSLAATGVWPRPTRS